MPDQLLLPRAPVEYQYVNGVLVSQTAESTLTLIETPVTTLFGTTYYHGTLILTTPDGTQTAFRGEPEGQINPVTGVLGIATKATDIYTGADIGLGNIEMSISPYIEGHPDWNPEWDQTGFVFPQRVVATGTKAELDAKVVSPLGDLRDFINNNGFEYNAAYQNSNSVLSLMLKRIGQPEILPNGSDGQPVNAPASGASQLATGIGAFGALMGESYDGIHDVMLSLPEPLAPLLPGQSHPQLMDSTDPSLLAPSTASGILTEDAQTVISPEPSADLVFTPGNLGDPGPRPPDTIMQPSDWTLINNYDETGAIGWSYYVNNLTGDTIVAREDVPNLAAPTVISNQDAVNAWQAKVAAMNALVTTVNAASSQPGIDVISVQSDLIIPPASDLTNTAEPDVTSTNVSPDVTNLTAPAPDLTSPSASDLASVSAPNLTTTIPAAPPQTITQTTTSVIDARLKVYDDNSAQYVIVSSYDSDGNPSYAAIPPDAFVSDDGLWRVPTTIEVPNPAYRDWQRQFAPTQADLQADLLVQALDARGIHNWDGPVKHDSLSDNPDFMSALTLLFFGPDFRDELNALSANLTPSLTMGGAPPLLTVTGDFGFGVRF